MSSFKPSKILLFGGTGDIGKHIMHAMLEAAPSHGWDVTVFTSSQAKADLLKSTPGVKSVMVGDVYSASDVSAAYRGIDTVVSALGRAALDAQTQLLRLAEESDSVRWFLPSEYGTDVEYGPQSADEKPHQKKLEVRRFVREHIRRVHVTYVVTGPFFDMWVLAHPAAPEAGGFVIETKTAYVIEDGDGKVGVCTMSDVGKSVAAVLEHPDVTFGKALKIQSFVVTPNDVLAEFEKQTGAKWNVVKTPLDTIRDTERRLYDEGKPQATMFTLRRIWAEGGTLYEKNDNELVGLRDGDMETLSVAVKKALTDAYKSNRG